MWWVTKAIDTNPENVILFAFHNDNGSVNVPQCYCCMYTSFPVSIKNICAHYQNLEMRILQY